MIIEGLLTLDHSKVVFMIDFTNHITILEILTMLLTEPTYTVCRLGGFCGGLVIAKHVG